MLVKKKKKITLFRTVLSQCQALSSEVLYRIWNALQAVPSIFLLFCPCTWELWLYWGCLLATDCDCMVMSFAMLMAFKSMMSIFPISKSLWGGCRVCFLGQCTFHYCVCFHTVDANSSLHCWATVKPLILYVPISLKVEDLIGQCLNTNEFGMRLIWLALNIKDVSGSTLFFTVVRLLTLTASLPVAGYSWTSFLRNRPHYIMNHSLWLHVKIHRQATSHL